MRGNNNNKARSAATGPWNNRIVGYGEEAPDQLLANPRNFRVHPTHQQAALSGVLREVGVVQNIIVNRRTGLLIDGHLRVTLALRDDQPMVPVTYVDLSEAEESVVLATLDPIAALATTDAQKLDELLREVSTGEAAVAQLLADMAEAAGILPDLPAAGEGGDEFDAMPDDGPTRCNLGDLWLIGGKHRLIIGDSTDANIVAKLRGDTTPILMVTDPPYGVQYDPAWRNQAGINNSTGMMGTVSNDDRIDWTAVYAQCGAHVAYVWHAGRHATEVAVHLRSAGFDIVSQIIWAKDRFALSRGDYHWQHEPCWYAVRKGMGHNWQGARDQSTLWEIRRLSSNRADSAEDVWGHGTQKPIECMQRPITNNTIAGDVVIDPFLGSGTTLIAAHRTNRVCYGMEIDPRYGDVILRRAEAEGLTVERVESWPNSHHN